MGAHGDQFDEDIPSEGGLPDGDGMISVVGDGVGGELEVSSDSPQECSVNQQISLKISEAGEGSRVLLPDKDKDGTRALTTQGQGRGAGHQDSPSSSMDFRSGPEDCSESDQHPVEDVVSPLPLSQISPATPNAAREEERTDVKGSRKGSTGNEQESHEDTLQVKNTLEEGGSYLNSNPTRTDKWGGRLRP